jgi:serine/threonine protein kinase
LANHGVSDTGIDFIARLLAKNPAERMTMAEALNHDWLAGPSSQQSQPNHGPLGGDSMWEIKSFDDEEKDSVMFGSEVGSEGGWTRPGTVSGTNLESRLGGGSSFFAGPGEGYVDSDESLRRRSKGDGKEGRVQQLQGQARGSSEDFSQPMGNLQLTTPAPKRQNSNEDNEGPDPTSPTRLNENGVNGDNGEQSELGDPGVETPDNKVGNSLLTPPLSDIAPTSLKRKQVALDAFSSGSLSPPPSSQPKGEEAAPPAASSRSSKQKTNGKSKSSPATIAAKEAGKVSPTSDVSPRRSTRPRKSLRKI